MRMLRFTLVLLLLLGQAAQAQNVRVKTGEHDTFTRVALNIPVGVGWRLEQTAAGYQLAIDGINSIDLDGFWDMIPPSRITQAEVAPDGKRLELAIACDCHATAELFLPNWLLIDVVDGPAPARTDTAAVEELAAPVASILVYQPGAAAAIDLPLLVEVPATPLDLPIEMPSPETAPVPDTSSDISALEERVLQSLTRAADQGLLQLALPAQPSGILQTPTAEVLAPIGATADLPESAAAVPLPLPDMTGPHAPGVKIQSGIDIARNGSLSDTEALTADRDCIADAVVDISQWGQDLSFVDQIGARRLAVTGEFDTPDPQAVEDLARTYLHFGFGREAIQALSIDNALSKERAVLIAMAQLLDGDPVRDTNFAGQVSCAGQVAFWAFLAQEDAASADEVDAAAITRTFKGLPLHLQALLGPRFAQRLLHSGETDIAGTALTIGQSMESPDSATALATSELALARGQPEVAEAVLDELVRTDGRLTPDAITELIGLRIAAGELVSQSELDTLDSIRFEYRSSASAPDLAILKIEALKNNKAYPDSISALAEESGLLSEGQIAVLRDSIVFGVTTDGTDADFLQIAFDSQVNSVLPETRTKIAARLIALGFHDRASALLTDPGTGADMSERRYLRAAVAIANGDIALAEATLSGIETPRAAAILAGVITDPDPDPALTDPPAPAISAWRERDWAALQAGDDAVLKAVSDILQRAPETAPESDAQLADGKALIADTETLRGTLTGLMERFPAPQQSPINGAQTN